MRRGTSLVVHCSDGWDRTAQIVSLVQLLVDPFARTIKGFVALCDREWLQFGHQFRTRLGLFPATDPDGESPIFVQFLDTVHQLLRQFPSAFELTEELLLRLTDSLYSGQHGTFIVNNPSEAAEWDLRHRTASVWAGILADSSLRSPLYDPAHPPLRPDTRPQVLTLWRRIGFVHGLLRVQLRVQMRWRHHSGGWQLRRQMPLQHALLQPGGEAQHVPLQHAQRQQSAVSSAAAATATATPLMNSKSGSLFHGRGKEVHRLSSAKRRRRTLPLRHVTRQTHSHLLWHQRLMTRNQALQLQAECGHWWQN